MPDPYRNASKIPSDLHRSVSWIETYIHIQYIVYILIHYITIQYQSIEEIERQSIDIIETMGGGETWANNSMRGGYSRCWQYNKAITGEV